MAEKNVSIKIIRSCYFKQKVVEAGKTLTFGNSDHSWKDLVASNRAVIVEAAEAPKKEAKK